MPIGRRLELAPDNADANFNEALALLTVGDYRRGFEKYEWRWKRTGMDAKPRFRQRPWLGEASLANKTILLHAEQGLGDTIQFVRYAPVLARAGAKVVLEVQPELKELLGTFDGVARVIGRGEAVPPFDLHCPLASLPLALKTELSSVPAELPYLRASEPRIARWRAAHRSAARAADRHRLVGPRRPLQRPQPIDCLGPTRAVAGHARGQLHQHPA